MKSLSRIRLFATLWDSPGKNTGVGCHFLLQGLVPTQGSNLGLLLGRWILYHWATWEAKAWMKNELLPTQRLEDMLPRRQTSGGKAEALQPQDLYPVSKPEKSHRKREQFKKSRVVSSGFQNDGLILTKLNKSTAGKTEQRSSHFPVTYLGQ